MTKLCIDAPVVVCRGIAEKLGLKVSGRRNAIGKVMGRRRCEWQSGTCPAFAVLFRTNSHTAPNYRVPLMSDTHDEAMCPSRKCAEWTAAMAQGEIRRLSKLAQRAQREATGYYCGYTFKRQPVGTKYLKALGETYNHVADSYKANTVTQQWHRISHRVLADFQHRCMVRTAPEEWNLASQWHAHDPTAAEFVRLYMSVDFPGRALLDRVEMEEKNLKRKEIRKIIPQAHGRGSGPEDYAKQFVDCYG